MTASPFEAELARRHMPDFLALVVPDYQRAKHIDLLCERLEALERRDIRRLMVFMPPRHAKTLHCSQALPAFWLGRRPAESVILASHSAELAEQNSRRARAFLQDPRWPFEGVAVSPESAAVGRWATTANGGIRAAGVGGAITGFGSHLLAVDDPFKDRADADSAAVRETVWTWYSQVALTRLQPGGVVLIVSTRWHTDDLCGRILSSPGAAEWEVLSLPALAEESDPLGRKVGDPLWDAWYDRETLEALREEMGSRAFSALYMQAPTPDAGAVFQRAWLEGRYSKLPDLHVVQAVDSAFKTGVANDYSVVATWGTDGKWFYLLDVARGRWEFPELLAAIEREAAEHSPTAILVEDAAAAQSAIQVLRRETSLPIVPVKAEGTKVSRAEAVSPLFESGKVLLPEQEPAWLGDWVEEHVTFDAGKHDDQVDTTSMALKRLRGRGRGGSGAIVIRNEGGRMITTRYENGRVVADDDRSVSVAAENQRRRKEQRRRDVAAERKRYAGGPPMVEHGGRVVTDPRYR